MANTGSTGWQGATPNPAAQGGVQFRANDHLGAARAGAVGAPPPLIAHKAWTDQTALTAKLRSTELKELDKALKDYEQKQLIKAASWLDFENVGAKFRAWKTKTGGDTARNRNGTVSELERLLMRGPASAWQESLIDSRRGLIYLYANTTVSGGIAKLVASGLGSIAASGFKLDQATSGMGVISIAEKAGMAVFTEGLKRAPGAATGAAVDMMDQKNASAAFRKLKESLEKYFTDILTTLRQLFDRDRTVLRQPDVWPGIGEQAGSIVKLVVGLVAKEAAPFVGGAIDTTVGLAKMSIAIGHRLRAYFAGAGVGMAPGHPGLVIRQIENAMNLAIGEGLYTALKGAANLAAEGASMGASKIASLVIAGTELLVKLIWRLVEMARMKSFFQECAVLWSQIGVRDAQGAYRSSPFLENGPEFGDWYRRASVAMPCLSALALTSGITGDKMRYLQMFTDGSERRTITPEAFARGVKFIDLMKVNAEKYLAASGFKFAMTGFTKITPAT
jgi:hypothetical protein